MNYDFKATEQKWQQKWDEAKVFEAQDNSEKPKFYGLVEFPYPSGAGMHVGHIKAYSGLEVVSRKRRLEGYNVLFPIGFDAYGLPTENYAIKTGIHPRKVTDMNIEKFTSQLKRVGFSFDYSRVVDTTDDKYYKWTQWIFLKMFENGLAFRDKTLVNYCPSCKVVLSNEDSQGGKCDICHSDIVQKSKDVWYLRITEYADKLLEGLEGVDYLPNIKLQQVNWIGKSTGAFVNFSIKDTDEKLEIYTTRPDTLFGVTYMVLAPEHALAASLATEETKDSYEVYKELLRDDLYSAVEKRVNNISNIGLIFSGGVDSTILAVLLKQIAEKRNNNDNSIPLNIKLYSVGVENSQDIKFSMEIAEELDLPLKTIIIDEDTVKESIKPVLTAIEDDNVMKLGVGMTIYLAAKAMKEDNIKVALSGQGADELFGGYNRYLKHFEENSLFDAYFALDEEIYHDIANMYHVNLERDDAVSMANGVELRVPFLDNEIISLALDIPAKYKIRNNEDLLRKHILRDVAKSIGVPDYIADRPKKAAQYGSGINKILKKRVLKSFDMEEFIDSLKNQ